MIRHLVKLTVPNATAGEFYDFMINPDNYRYRQWWPKEHLQFRITKRGEKNHLWDDVYYDEFLGGKRRSAFHAVVVKVENPRRIIWQMKKLGIRLPAFLLLGLHDSTAGLRIRHELRVGFTGIGRFLDPFIRLYITKSFLEALERHCRIEWLKLAEHLKKESRHKGGAS